jgi:hypothetical protein
MDLVLWEPMGNAWPGVNKVPCIFPGNRESVPETSSLETAPSSGESANSRSQHVAEGTSSNAHPIVLGGVIRQQMAEVPFPQDHDMV